MDKREGLLQLLRFAAIIAAGISTALGGVVLIGWYTHSITLIQILPTFVPMQFNTALGFLLCGIGLLSQSSGLKRLAVVCGAVAGTVGFLTILQYTSGADLGIDQLFMKHYIIVKTSHPGRMAPNTATCFGLSGLALVIANQFGKLRYRSLVIGLLGSIVIALSLVAFLGYISGIETAFGWGALTRMAIHTAVGFIILGTGIFMLAWREGALEDPTTIMPLWFAFPVGIGMTTIAVTLWQALMAEAYASQGHSAVLPYAVLVTGFMMTVLSVLVIRLAQTSSRRAISLEEANLKLEEYLSECKRGAAALGASEERFHGVADNLAIGISLISPDMEILNLNKQMMSWFPEIDPAKRPIFYKAFNSPQREEICSSTLEDGQVHEAETETPVGDEIRHYKIIASPLKDLDGKVVAAIEMVEDITERKRADEQFSQEAEVTKNLLRLSEATSKISDVDELMKCVIKIVRDITGSDLIMSYRWDPETNTLRPCDVEGLTRDMLPIFKTTPVRLDSTLIKGAMDSGRVFIESNKTGSEPLIKLKQDGLCEWIEDAEGISLLPLVGKREYLGLIVCVCYDHAIGKGDRPSNKTRELMQAVANQVSIALYEARQYKESVTRAMDLSRKVETIEIMSEISKLILSTLDVNNIIEMTAKMVSRLTPCDWVRVIEVDKVKEELRFLAGFEKGGVFESMVVPFSATSLTEVVDTGRPQYIADLRTADSPLDIERALLKDGYLSVLRVPIAVKGEVVGVLGLMSRRTSTFSPENLSTLQKLSTQVGVAIKNARLVTDLEEFSIGTIKALAEAIDAKSPWTSGHSDRVTEIALNIGEELNLSEDKLKDLRIAGLLHDIGKIGTDESILNKPGKLTEEELKEIRKHPGKGVEILAHIKQLTHILPVIKGHHEFYDGTGYPEGLKGTEIPLHARILTVADTVDAMGADRPYRNGLPQERIVDELKRYSGTQFDPAVVEAYLETFEEEGWSGLKATNW
jgi:putative nucleotidyltransferase with HDIG domain